MLGSHNGTSKIYLTVGFGKIRQKSLENRQKVEKDTPGAVKRQTQAGADSWAIEHDFVSGTIENIFYKEDKQYGNSFEITLNDVADTYQLSLSETNRNCIDFLKKLPNLDMTNKVKLTAYDFVDKLGKRRAGLSIEQDGQKISSYYEQKQADGTWKLLHKFPSGEGVNFKDDDDAKIYFIKVKKFLKAQFDEFFANHFNSKNAEPNMSHIEDAAPDISNEPDDLPF